MLLIQTSVKTYGSLPRRRLDAGYHYDHSYLLNEALWDSYFLSTVPRSVTSKQMEELDFTLPNERLKLRRDPRIQWRSGSRTRRSRSSCATSLHGDSAIEATMT